MLCGNKTTNYIFKKIAKSGWFQCAHFSQKTLNRKNHPETVPRYWQIQGDLSYFTDLAVVKNLVHE